MFVGPSIGTPNILSLYLSDSISSIAFFIAWNSLPNVLASVRFAKAAQFGYVFDELVGQLEVASLEALCRVDMAARAARRTRSRSPD